MWANAISNMIIKAADNMNRGAENASKAGKGNNGQNYQIDTGDTETTASSGGYTPTGGDTSGAEQFAETAKGATSKVQDLVSNIDNKGEGDEGEEEKEKATEGVADMGNIAGGIGSDERIKNIFGENEDIIKTFAKIKAIQFTYNDKAKEIPDGENKGVDDDVHLGIKAQDLEANPLTASAVKEDPSTGYKLVDTKELTAANSAVISELCRRIEILEKILGVKVV